MQIVITAAIPGWESAWSQGSVVTVHDDLAAELIAAGVASADEAPTVVVETAPVQTPEPAPLS